jgi:hypothetical protein
VRGKLRAALANISSREIDAAIIVATPISLRLRDRARPTLSLIAGNRNQAEERTLRR